MPLFLEDRPLLNAFRAGENAALTRVYEAYSDPVAAFLAGGAGLRLPSRSPLLRPVDLEAAHQDTFVRAFQPRARLAYDGLRPYRPYLFRIARSAAVDGLRAGGKLQQGAVALDDSLEATVHSADVPTPEQSALKGETQQLMLRFLETLSPAERTFAQLRFTESRTQAEVGALLNLSRAELRTRERHLREALVRHLRAAGWLEETQT